MKTITLFSLALAASLSLATAEEKSLGEKTADTLKKAGEKTKEAGRNIAASAEKAKDKMVDAVTPDKDAKQIAVVLTGKEIDMPKEIDSGKIAFVVRNADKAGKHNFKIMGGDVDKKFFMDIAPNDSKVLHVDLKPGTYTISCPDKAHMGHGEELKLTVK